MKGKKEKSPLKVQNPRHCRGLHKNRGEEKNEKDISKFMNRTVFSAVVCLSCYAFIIGSNYEEKKRTNIKLVLNYIIIFKNLSEGPGHPRQSVSFPLMAQKKSKKGK